MSAGAAISSLREELSRVRTKLRGHWREGLALFVLASVAFQIVLDFRILPPTHLAWMFVQDTDPPAYYLASAYYRNDAWHFPLFEMRNLLYPLGASFTMMDAIPIAGFLTKLLSFALPADFQYLGLWLYSCILLNAVFGYLVLGRLVTSRALRWVGTCLVTFAPPLVNRSIHAALCTHWLLLASFWTVLEDRTLPRKRLWGLAALSFFVNPVLMVMVNGILVGVFWVHRHDRRKLAVAAGGWLLVLGLSAWVLGYFNVHETRAAVRDYYFSDVTSLVSSYGTASIIPTIPPKPPEGGPFGPWTIGENYTYLGLGGILLLIALLADLIRRVVTKDRTSRPSDAERALTILCLLMAAYAISPAPHVLGVRWDGLRFLLKVIEPILSRLRVPARFLWPLFYYLLLFGTRAVERWLSRVAWPRADVVAAAAVLLAQAIDLGPWLVRHGKDPAFTHPPPPPALPESIASRWTPSTRYLILDPPIQRRRCPESGKQWAEYDELSFAVGLFGARHNLIANTDFRISARLSDDDLSKICRYGEETSAATTLKPDVLLITHESPPPPRRPKHRHR